MSPEERQLLVDLFQRTNAASGQPRDRDAEAFIAEAVRLQPYAPYLLAQTVIMQEHTMRAASERLQQLEAENRQLQDELSRQDQPAPQAQGGFLGGLGSLLGGGAQPAAPPPVPQSRPGGPWGAAAQSPQPGGAWSQSPPQGGAWNNAPAQAAPPPQQGGGWGGAAAQSASPLGGGGFLKGALGAAAGVAGGALLMNSLGGLFGSHGGGGLTGGLGALGGQAGHGETVVNNYYGDDRSGVQNAGYDDAPEDAAQDLDDADDAGSDESYDA